MPTSQALIDVHDLERTFEVRRKVDGRRRRTRESVRAVHDLTFAVDAGEMVGYIGPNGAGKTTAIRMLLGLLNRDRGDVRVLGLDPTVEPLQVRAGSIITPGTLTRAERPSMSISNSIGANTGSCTFS